MNENEIIMENLDTVEGIMEVIPEKKNINFTKVGLGVLAVGAVAALGFKAYKVIKKKMAQKAQEAEDADYVTVEDDYDDEESAE